ncbi:hypothetical protein [Devosia pacifica]|nr:hypothetical protein [Devosia pacifica]
MTERHFDFAVYGSTPFARLLAVFLAEAHQKSVILIGAMEAHYRLAHGFDLSVAPITRPETWRLLAKSESASRRMLTRLGARRAMARFDPLFLASSPDARLALSHFAHMASAFDRAIEAIPDKLAPAGYQAITVRDCLMLDRQELEPVLLLGLETRGVVVSPEAESHFGNDGSVSIRLAGGDAYAAQTAVLADDEAIVRYIAGLPAHPLLEARPMISMLTEPTRALGFRLRISLDGAMAFQRSTLGLAALAFGQEHRAMLSAGSMLTECGSLRRIAQSAFTTLTTADGAGIAGKIGQKGPTLIGGFGPVSAFMAPEFASWLAGTADRSTEAYIAARSPDRNINASRVGDIRIVDSGVERAA